VAASDALTRARSLADRLADLFPVRVVRKFAEHGGPNQAVIIAWNYLTAIFPIVLALAAIGGLLLNAAGFTAQTFAERLGSLLPGDLGTQQAVIEGINSLQQQTGLFALLALVGFIWTGSGLFGAMESVFAVVFETPSRPFIRQKLMALLMMALFVVLSLLAVGTSALLPLLDQIPGMPISVTRGDTGFVLQAAVGFVAGFLLFFAIYAVVPNRRQRLDGVLAAALFGGVAFELLTLLWPVYIRFNQVGLNRFGSQFAFLFVLLAFFYFLGLITVIGADITAVLDTAASSKEKEPAAHEQTQAAPQPKPLGRVRRTAFGAAALLIGFVAGRRSRP
jgi:YihY family inner membrane protein